MKPTAAAIIAAALISTAAFADQYLMMPDSLNNRLVLLNVDTGAVENPSYFLLGGNLPFHAIQVGNEIWISEQNGARVSRWSLTGEPVGTITGNLTNIRGMEFAHGVVYISRNANAVEVFDPSGNFQFSFSTAMQAQSPFSVLEHDGSILVGASTPTYDEVHRYSFDGQSRGRFADSPDLDFVEQMSHDLDGNVLVASFTGAKIATLKRDTGQILSSFTASSPRGVYQLPNGNVLWTNSAGIHLHHSDTGADDLIYSGSGRYIDLLELPPPATCGPADFNGDGDVGTDQDIESFFTCLGGDCCPTCWEGGADFNGDGDVGTDQDIEAFFRVLGGGPC